MPELPPQSRITSRIDGEILSISIPRSSTRLGCIGESWSLAAVFGFLTICSFAQGVFGGNPAWTAAGFFFFLITGWQLLALRGGLLRPPGITKIEISPESLSKLSGSANAPHRRSWPRSVIVDVRVEPKSDSGPASLNLHVQGESNAVSLFSCDDPEELEWIADQIRRRLAR
ncbi:MAG TPA: hypothetical protein VGG44_05960 [Tepidisphaeraceae bacterium]